MNWCHHAVPCEQQNFHKSPKTSKLWLTILVLIGCFSAATPAAAVVPALGGYASTGYSVYVATEAMVMDGAQNVAVGCTDYSGGLTICYDAYEVVNATPWSVLGTWQWGRQVQTRIPVRRTTDGINWSTDYQYTNFPIILTYFCPYWQGYDQFVEDQSTWQPGTGWPTCTDGSPPPPPPSTCSGQSGYVINLYGPGGTNGALANVEPGNSESTLRANVSCAGQPVSGKQVALAADVITHSGGHQHDQGRRPQHSGAVAFNGSNTTDANGNVAFTFTAPAPAGDHTITASCADGSCGTATGNVWVGIEGLEPIGPGPWSLTGARTEHPDNHYLTVPAFLVLQQLGLHWRRFYVPFGPVFRVNDASLVRGGLFDCCETYTDGNGVVHDRRIEGWWTPPHIEHRRGTVVDINGIRRADEREFERYVREALRGNAQIHGAGTGRHYHVRLMGVRE